MILFRTYTDHQLVAFLKEGSEKAYDELFRRYWKKAFTAAYGKVKSKAQAEEIVQDIFMDLWDKRASLSIQCFSRYLHTSVKYQALNKIRARIVHDKYWDYYRAFISQADNTTEKAVHFQDLLEKVEERLDQFPKKTKAVFRMNKIEGKSLKEIAALMKLSEKAIEYHLSQSLKVLKVYLRNSLLPVLVCLICL